MLYCGRLGPLAQLAEHLPFKQGVAGSSPARLTKQQQSANDRLFALC
jgi:hypothetical protein